MDERRSHDAAHAEGDRASGSSGRGSLGAEISAVGRWISDLYALDLEVDGGAYLVSHRLAQRLLPAPSPRTGLLAIEQAEELQLGIYVDPRDRDDHETLVEETSHLVCLAWHAARNLPVSALVLELQGEIDRFLYRCHHRGGFDGAQLDFFERGRWADWIGLEQRGRYEHARTLARRYCRTLVGRFGRRRDTVGLAGELRRFYRASPSAKLRV